MRLLKRQATSQAIARDRCASRKYFSVLAGALLALALLFALSQIALTKAAHAQGAVRSSMATGRSAATPRRARRASNAP